jgi:NAD-dependent deacetylase
MPMAEELKASIQELAEILAAARCGVAFTGAGVSTESGIPDFRSPGGLWSRNMPIPFGDFMTSSDARAEAWRRKFTMDDSYRGARPNATHNLITRLIREGRFRAVITQNIDNLHLASGLSPEEVIELHGNGSYATCLACGIRHELDWVRREFEATGEGPLCPACGGLVKSATISFGQPMPAEPMRRAQEVTLAADVFLVLGSSLVVYPAAGFVMLAKERGATVVIVNREPTGFDGIADLVIHAELGDVIATVATRN